MPLVNEQVTVGGSVKTSIAFNMAPYLETYIDKGYQLPYDHNIYQPVELLPNKQFTQNSGNQASASLRKIDIDKDEIHQQNTANASLNQMNKFRPDMDLMNSKEWSTVAPGEQFTFEHTTPIEDLKWRSTIRPFWVKNWGTTNTNTADAMSRWDGFVYSQDSTVDYGNNLHLTNHLISNPIKPAPNCIVRPVTVHDADGNLLPIVFQVLIKYHAWIELDLNEIAIKPILNRQYTATPDASTAYNMFYQAGGTGVPNNNTQWCGASAAGNFLNGPQTFGGII